MRTRYYCTRSGCTRVCMRVVGGAGIGEPCPACGSEMRPTDRLAGGQPSERSASITVWVRPDVQTALAKVALERKGRAGPATIANEVLEAWANRKGRRRPCDWCGSSACSFPSAEACEAACFDPRCSVCKKSYVLFHVKHGKLVCRTCELRSEG